MFHELNIFKDMFLKKTVLVLGFDAKTVDFLVEHKRLTKTGVKETTELCDTFYLRKLNITFVILGVYTIKVIGICQP